MHPSMSWLSPPIRAPRPLPLLPGHADDAARAESAVCGGGTSGNKRKALTGAEKIHLDAHPPKLSRQVNPFTLAAATSSANPNQHPIGRPTAKLAAGDYHLPDAGAVLRYAPGAVQCTKADYEELWNFANGVPPTPNPMHLPGPPLRRKQATFGAMYRFGQQVSMRVDGPEETWPGLVRLVLNDARSRIGEAYDKIFAAATAAHVNWYPDGRAGMGKARYCAVFSSALIRSIK